MYIIPFSNSKKSFLNYLKITVVKPKLILKNKSFMGFFCSEIENTIKYELVF